MTLSQILEQLGAKDDDFTKLCDEIGVLKGFAVGQSVFAPERMRLPFLTSILSFRPVYLLHPQFGNLVVEKFSAPFTQSEIAEGSGLIEGLELKTAQQFGMSELAMALVGLGYERVFRALNEGEFSIKGGFVEAVLPRTSEVVQVDYFGDELENIRVNRDVVKKVVFPKSLRKLVAGVQTFNTANLDQDAATDTFDLGAELEKLESNALVVIPDPVLIDEELNDEFIETIGVLKNLNLTAISLVSIGEYNWKLEVHFPELLMKFEEVWESESEMLQNKKGPRTKKLKRKILNPDELEVGDFVVHDVHGVGEFVGREMRNVAFTQDRLGQSKKAEYLKIKYASGSRKYQWDYLHIRVDDSEALGELALYVGVANPKLNTFGGAQFAKIKSKARQHTFEVAKKLVKLYAERLNSEGIQFRPDSDLQLQFESSFGFELTPDQKEAAEAIKLDMESSYPMDRLLTGDVGFGKTEVALRAAFKAVDSGKQVALLAPTTILALQHFDTITSRLKKFPVRVALLTGFQTAKERLNILKATEAGKVDVLIGTHSILADAVVFDDLGLLIIDEEQRFGALHKEKLKEKYPTVDVLTLSATPIPRTLEMAMTGIRDVSTLSTPPVGRLPIQTRVLEKSDGVIEDAVREEIKRGGQVFFVYNNTHTISSVVRHLESLVPGIRVGVAHSKLSEGRIDRVLEEFYHKKLDVLVCTTIIETGLDIPNVNTLIVDHAEKFGLTQLHQLRGRVGRRGEQGYAFFLYPPGTAVTEQAHKRLEVLGELSDLGAGAEIAIRDLEMRGAGNYLGKEQSGHITAVGYDMYIKMMAVATQKLKERNL